VQDLTRHRFYRFLNKAHIIFPILLAFALYFWGGLPFLVWGFFVRTVFVYHVTWFVNSATHKWGYKTYATEDDSRNLWWVALLSFGEGWHNNHHAFQRSTRHGLKPWEFDQTFLTIKLLSWLKLAKEVQVPKLPKQELPNPPKIEDVVPVPELEPVS
jgi:stearoyl-CoA desaturase (delta-9 desaturase)